MLLCIIIIVVDLIYNQGKLIRNITHKREIMYGNSNFPLHANNACGRRTCLQ
jgi:hypothetical protein